MAIKIAITNQKGGVAKTSTTINLADALKHFDYKVLTIDFDPSCNATSTYGAEREDVYTLYDVLDNACKVSEAIQHTDLGDIIPGDELLAENLDHFSGKMARESLLKKKLKEVDNEYDFIVIDTPPPLGLYMLNALVAADGCVIPLKAEHYSVAGLKLLFKTIENVISSEINENLRIYGTLITQFDARTKIDRELLEELPKVAKSQGFNHFKSYIRICQEVKNVQNLSDAENKSLYYNAPNCSAAKDYVDFTKELLEVINNG